jgi:hypothetical protein
VAFVETDRPSALYQSSFRQRFQYQRFAFQFLLSGVIDVNDCSPVRRNHEHKDNRDAGNRTTMAEASKKPSRGSSSAPQRLIAVLTEVGPVSDTDRSRRSRFRCRRYGRPDICSAARSHGSRRPIIRKHSRLAAGAVVIYLVLRVLSYARWWRAPEKEA